MKQLVFIITLFFIGVIYSQSPQVDSERFVSKTNAQEAAFAAFSAGARLIYNSELSKWRYRVGGGAWQDLGTGGGGSGGIATSDQTLSRGLGIYNTAASTDIFSYRQETVELMRIGGNNDQAVYIKAIETLPGETFISLIGALRPHQIDITGAAANTRQGGIVRNTVDQQLYYSDGTNWIKATPRLDVHPNSDEPLIRFAIANNNASRDALTLLGYDVVFCKACTPDNPVTGATQNMNKKNQWLDDRTTDHATITFANLLLGGTLKIAFNRASEPTYAGATMKQLPNTLAFPANTECVGVFNVNHDGEIDYYYYEVTP